MIKWPPGLKSSPLTTRPRCLRVTPTVHALFLNQSVLADFDDKKKLPDSSLIPFQGTSNQSVGCMLVMLSPINLHMWFSILIFDATLRTKRALPAQIYFFAKHCCDWKENHHILIQDSPPPNLCLYSMQGIGAVLHDRKPVQVRARHDYFVCEIASRIACAH